MLALSLQFMIFAAVIVVAAMFLAKFGDELADLTGMGGSVTGLVLLAGATSLPELSVGYSAVRLDAVDPEAGGINLTAGGVLGSSLVNLLILALIDLISRRPGRILTRSASAHALSATVGALLTGLILLGILLDQSWMVGRMGVVSLAVIVAYTLCARLLFLDQRESASQAAAEQDEPSESEAASGKAALIWNGLGFFVATVVIFMVAPQLAMRADAIANLTGLGETFIGTLLVAAVTSLPEAVSTVAAVRLGAVDMAIANIFGSNAFNMVIFAILDVATPNSLLGTVSETHAITAVCALVITAIGLLSILSKAPKRLWVVEPDAALIAILVIGSLYLVYAIG